jgi:hypothetical protein
MVSTMMAVWGELPWRRLPLYVTAQLAGGALGSAAQYYSLPRNLQKAANAGIQVCFVAQRAPIVSRGKGQIKQKLLPAKGRQSESARRHKLSSVYCAVAMDTIHHDTDNE